MLAMSLVVVTLMTVLTFWTVNRVERAALSGAGAVGALYLQTFVSPLIKQEDVDRGSLDTVLTDKLKSMLGTGPLGQHIKSIKIWKLDGSLLYSTSGQTIKHPRLFDELASAFSGEIVVSRTTNSKHQYTGQEVTDLLIEVYAPLWRDSTGRIALVGEFYGAPNYLTEELRSMRRMTVLVTGAITLPMIGLLYVIVSAAAAIIARQRRAIEHNLEHALNLSAQNNRLRLGADYARLEAGKLNEKILDQIGADLHDGPLQVLTLIKLRLSDLLSCTTLALSDQKEKLAKVGELVSNVVGDLRSISAGLVLPELDRLSVEDTIRLAVQRYGDLTGNSVELIGHSEPGIISPHLNVCTYRVIQEALMNGFRHAPGNSQKVRYRITAQRLVFLVADLGSDASPPNERERERTKLGKIAQKRRVRAFGGKIRSFKRRKGTIVAAILPVMLAEASPSGPLVPGQ
ncbi:sensor histidine kinase [Pararhizobium sp.]|uniref:sensor histidine kinase n=1 Tax=Pararhizobium sp. TaxID=1977563 RepID=UPI0027276F3D|nr:ATP-binding protein [Pararhizobium sp.]MDO9417828.1 histidine kinase [Pararhizobium sp.]